MGDIPFARHAGCMQAFSERRFQTQDEEADQNNGMQLRGRLANMLGHEPYSFPSDVDVSSLWDNNQQSISAVPDNIGLFPALTETSSHHAFQGSDFNQYGSDATQLAPYNIPAFDQIHHTWLNNFDASIPFYPGGTYKSYDQSYLDGSLQGTTAYGNAIDNPMIDYPQHNPAILISPEQHQQLCSAPVLPNDQYMESYTTETDLLRHFPTINPTFTVAKNRSCSKYSNRKNSNLRNLQPNTNGLRDLNKTFKQSTLSSVNKVPKRRRTKFDEEKRMQVASTREQGACLRCRSQRIACKKGSDPDGPCGTCEEATPTLYKLPCLRYRIPDTQLLDKAAHPRFSWTTRWNSMKIVEVDLWASSDVKRICLTQDIDGLSYQLEVREFIPRNGDSLSRKWRNAQGEIRSHPCSNYAIANMAKTALDLSKWVDEHMCTIIRHCIRDRHPLLWKTYCMAEKQAVIAKTEEERELLRNVLRLFAVNQMESKRERIEGEENLGMDPQTFDSQASNYGHICVPPVMEAQIEIISTAGILFPTRNSILRALNQLIKKNEPALWMTIYLSNFVLLHSCALLTGAERGRALREIPQNQNTRYFNPPTVEELHVGANCLLAHFHMCNKGSIPFELDWTKRNPSKFAKLDHEQTAFVRDTMNELQGLKSHFESIAVSGAYEDDFYFVCQLYERDWKPRFTIF